MVISTQTSNHTNNHTSEIPSALRDKYVKAGQEHIFRWIDSLDSSELARFLAQLETFDIEQVMKDFKASKDAAKEMTSRLQPAPLQATDVIHDDDHGKFWTIGLSAIKRGKVAVVTLAGGQGTRLGSSAPKGCFNIGLPSQMSLFEMQALRLRKLIKLADAKELLWYIMTSAATHKATVDFFTTNNFFGLGEGGVKFFKQGELPALTEEGKIILKDKESLALSPNGNGGIYAALKEEGVLAELKTAGVEFVHMYCVDNALVRIGDPTFIGACIEKGTDCAAKTIKKTDPSESVGVFCRRQDGKMAVAEYSEFDANMAEKTDRDGNLVFNHANIANHFFSIPFLEKCANLSLPTHLARKKIPSIDEAGNPIKTALMGMKLEKFIFDVFEHGEKPVVYQGDRDQEFSPLKNAAGADCDSPDHCRKAVLDLHGKWLIQAGAIVEGEVEISPLISYGGEGLEAWKGKKVSGRNMELLAGTRLSPSN
ncbi:UDP-N-acetylglucosamine diphosphorylase [Paramicrosporidium saccamoebae]|uniref:UDP-N-acetylglucosamine diphosphorylase n=1 Tax=Paramicrosporidium saccamoebae TaxID=1246581 RepID=A0A2H9TG95_9FUNG|nr:UDP-N-acetylglucosamine diphosphorylase [Paramicrosporidium saccamoebae]